MTKIQTYTDGSARGNSDDSGGCGTVLYFTDSNGQLYEKTMSGGYVRATNNRVELTAAIVGLEVLNRSCQMELYSDSRYLTDAFNRHRIDSWVTEGWDRRKSGPVKNIDLREHLLKVKGPYQVKFTWVEGHAGHPEDEGCNTLVASMADDEDLMTDQGLEV